MAADHLTRYEYDELGRLIASVDPLGATTRYEYDPNGNLTALVAPLGQRTEWAYDAKNRPTRLTDAAGYSTESSYDAVDRLIQITGPRGGVTRYSYDEIDNLVEEIDPLGTVTRYEYDGADNLTAIIDAANHRTDYVYDAVNRLINITQPPVKVPNFPTPQRPTTRFTYDKVGNISTITSPRDFTTVLTYDENDNLRSITDPLGGQTSYRYDEEDNPVTITDPKGYSTTVSYNEIGLPVQVKDPLGGSTRLTYDADYYMGRMINALGQPTTYEYDPAGRLIRQIDPLDHMTVYERNLQGQIIAKTDANDHTTRYSYDVMDRLIAVTDALNQPTRYEYDPAGNLVAMIDANSQTTRFAYDLRNQLIKEVNPLDHTWHYGYDAVGNLVRRVDGNQIVTRYNYDSHNRLIGVDYPDGATVRFIYDLDGNEVEMCDWLAAEGDCTRTSYDPLGRPTRSTDWLGRTIQRAYDASGNLTRLVYPNNQPVVYDYDARNQLVGLQDHFGQHTTYAYNPIGQLTHINRPNGTTTSYAYDESNRLLNLTHQKERSTFSAFTYALDKVGNRTQIAELRTFPGEGDPIPVTTVKSYSYDTLDRLTTADTDQGQAIDYSFDPVGNRLQQAGIPQEIDPTDSVEPIRPAPPIENAYDYNEANQLTAVSSQQSAVRLEYDDNGNRVRETETLANGSTHLTEYRYDYENRLTGVIKTEHHSTQIRVTMVATYTYDGYGRRVKKEVRDATRNTQQVTQISYVYDGLDPIADYETIGRVTTATHYYWANGGIAEIERLPNPITGFGGDVYWTHTDGLGSLTDLTDVAGERAVQVYYDEYGQLLTRAVSLGRYSYTGQEFDPETGLYHFYARYYEPERGGWLTQDLYRGQLNILMTLHRYGYVGNNPISYLDKYGLAAVFVHGINDDGSGWKNDNWWQEYNERYHKGLNGKSQDELKYCTENGGQASSESCIFDYQGYSNIVPSDLAAERLYQQIKDKKDIVLVAHSKGGNVTENLLARYGSKLDLKGVIFIEAATGDIQGTVGDLILMNLFNLDNYKNWNKPSEWKLSWQGLGLKHAEISAEDLGVPIYDIRNPYDPVACLIECSWVEGAYYHPTTIDGKRFPDSHGKKSVFAGDAYDYLGIQKSTSSTGMGLFSRVFGAFQGISTLLEQKMSSLLKLPHLSSPNDRKIGIY